MFHGEINLRYVETSFVLIMQVVYLKHLWPCRPSRSVVTWELLLPVFEYVHAVSENDFRHE